MTIASQTVDENLEKLAEKVDMALSEVRKLDAQAQKQALALKTAIEEFHKVGITQIVKKLKGDPRGKELLFELVDDPTVYALFAMHGIVRADVTTRANRVINMVRPYMQSHGGDVELVRIEGDTAFVKLHGACNGCSMSAVTLRETVEEALFGQIGELKRLEVVPNDPGPALISLDSLQVVTEDSGWIEGPVVEAVAQGTLYRLDVDQESYVIVNLENKLSAFENSCAHMGLPIDSGLLDCENGTLTCPWHGWCYNASSGECLTAPQAQLEPLPLRITNGRIWIRTA
ncbi:MAG: NifU family protein [Caldilineaceae bacterium]